MKKMTTPKQLALPYFIGKVALVLSTFLLLTSATMLVQAPQPRVPFPDFQNSPLPVSDFVERYDALMINDPTAGFLDAEAEYLAGVVQRVLGYTDVFKTYEFRMYGPSLIANGEIAFESAAGSFADKIENGGVVAVRGKGGQPELRKVTQNTYYLMIAMQAQGGDAVKFKVVLKLPKKAGVSDAEHATMEGALAKLCESELLNTWNSNKIIEQASIAEAKGVRKMADMLANWTPGQILTSEQIGTLLDAEGFFKQLLDCGTYDVKETLAGQSSNVAYFSSIVIKDNATNTSTNFEQQLISAIAPTLKEVLKFDVFFIVTSDKDFQTAEWVQATQLFQDKNRKLVAWIHYQEHTSAQPCGSLRVSIKNDLTKAELEKGLGTTKQATGENSWLNWRTVGSEHWMLRGMLFPKSDNIVIQANNEMIEFGFGVICGIIDGILEQVTGLVNLGQTILTLTQEAVKVYQAKEEFMIGLFIKLFRLAFFNELVNDIYQSLGLGTIAEGIAGSLDKSAQDHLDYAKELINNLALFKAAIEFYQSFDTYEEILNFVQSAVDAVVEWLGGMLSSGRKLGYEAGKVLVEIAINWFTAGAGMAAKIGTQVVTKALKDCLLDLGKVRSSSGFIGKIKSFAEDVPHPRASVKERVATCAAKLGCFISGTLVLTTLGAQSIEALNPATPIPVYQAASTASTYDPSTTTEFGIQALNATHTLPGDVQDIDREEITPATWRWLHLSYTKPDGTTAQIYLRRPLWWMQQHGIRAPGDKLTLLMPEMGIVGRAQLEAILPSTLDTRSWDYRAQGDYAYYPLTGFFAHESAEVWDLYFSSSKQPVGATYNHPFYSTDRAQYVYAGELALGERILTQSGDTVQFLLKRPHAGLSTKVYNLEVWRAHNFLVTEKGMVVHNNGCMVEVMGGKNLLCLMEDLKKRLKDPSLEAKLEKALQDNDLLEAAIKGNPDLVKAWEVMSSNDLIAQDEINVKEIFNYLERTKKNPQDLQKIFNALSNDYAKTTWISYLNKVFRLLPNQLNHILKGEIRISKIDARTGAVIEEYTYTPGSGGILPEKGFNYKVKTAGGLHQEKFIDGINSKIIGTKRLKGKLPTGEEIFEADIEFFVKELNAWKQKSNPSTFFPDSWGEDKIQSVIKEASENLIEVNGRNYTGVTSNGIKIEFWKSSNSDEIESAWIKL